MIRPPRYRLLRFGHRWPFLSLQIGGCLTLTLLCKGARWTWRGWEGSRLYDEAGGSRVFRLGPLVVNYLPRRRR